MSSATFVSFIKINLMFLHRLNKEGVQPLPPMLCMSHCVKLKINVNAITFITINSINEINPCC